MTKLKSWCHCTSQTIRAKQELHTLVANAMNQAEAIDAIAGVMPGHYASETRIADIFARLGKHASADYIRDKLPTTATLRFGELGEILAATYVADYSPYQSIRKLRWKDHRNMAMRGDDILGVRVDAAGQMRFLKGEVKSRGSLTTGTIKDARKALKASRNRPSPHALASMADRLDETGDAALGAQILEHQYKLGIKLDQVTHFIFTFSGNDPLALLQADLAAYSGTVRQHVVGLHINEPNKFVGKVYRKVIANG
ncbi:MAG: Hachiman antiphage defense system protein HamA [Sphingorhabdus sp.]